MSRMERANMVKYIEMKRGLKSDRLMEMTDADIEHMYETIYYYEQHAE